jgi:hypothetical protein
VAVVLFLGSIARFWHPVFGFTSFLVLDSSNDNNKIAAFKSHPVYVYRNGGYDGLYYAQLAYHPTLMSPELAGALDSPAYRARRILAPALAYALALGRQAWIVHVYSILNPIAWLVLAALLWRLLPVRGWRSWLAWAGVLFSTGVLCSVRLALTDLLALTIVAGAMAYAEQSRHELAAGIVAAAALARETSVLAIAGVVQRPWMTWKNAWRVTLAVTPVLLWMLYVSWVFGRSDQGWTNFTTPLAGLAGKVSADAQAVREHTGSLLAWTTLLATAGLIVQIIFFVTRVRLHSPLPDDHWWRVGAMYVFMMTMLGVAVWEGFPGAATRVLLPMTLAFNVMAARGRARLAWLLAGNLAVLNGALVMSDVPQDPHEIGAGRTAGAAIVARTSDEWYGVEREWRHARAWSPWRGHLDVEAWPHDTRRFELVASVRSRQSIVLTVLQDKAVVWRSAVLPFPRAMKLEVPCVVVEGRARLDFVASPYGQLETPEVHDRPPIFAVEDVGFRFSRPGTD